MLTDAGNRRRQAEEYVDHPEWQRRGGAAGRAERQGEGSGGEEEEEGADEGEADARRWPAGRRAVVNVLAVMVHQEDGAAIDRALVVMT